MSSQLSTLEQWPLVSNFAGRELRTRYRRSILGWTWSLINPLVTIGVYTLVFNGFFGAQAPRGGDGDLDNFAIFLFAGLVVWNLFSAMVTGPMVWLMGVSDLLRKVSFPSDAAIFGGAISAVVQVLIEAALLIVILFMVGNYGWTMLAFPYVLVCTLGFGLGLGFVLSVANAYYRDVSYLVSVVLQVLFWLTPIIYDYTLIPEERWGLPVRDLALWLNPVAQFVLSGRDAVYLLEWPSPGQLLYITVAGFAMFFAGWRAYGRWSVDISEHL